ncbi:hypothetical protein [Jiella sp. M17.18]|uniref:hypothetical protein n=1 Tax=Jiella sp. M17.18 TaxID=3234247 RepID=UPI0034DEF8C4
MIVAFPVLLGACATSPISDSEATPAASTSSELAKYATAKPGTATVIVKRDAGLMGAACASRLFVDGSVVADLWPGEAVTLHLPVTSTILSVKPEGVCGGGTYETTVTPNPSKESKFRVGYGTNGDFFIVPTAF